MLIKVEDFQFTQNNPLSLKSVYLKAGVNKLQQKGLITEQDHEKVIEIEDLILEMYNILKNKDKRFGNDNARKK